MKQGNNSLRLRTSFATNRFMLLLPIVGALVVLGSSGLSATAYAASLEGGPFILEGGGFVMSDIKISNSNLDLLLKSRTVLGDRVVLSVVDGVVSLGTNDIILEEKQLSAISIRDGKFLRISGSIGTSDGRDVTLDLFGRIVEETKVGSIYSFLGSVSQDQAEPTKAIFTTRLTNVSEVPTFKQQQPEQQKAQPEEKKKKEVTVTILPGASNPGSVKYFSIDPVRITPGTTVTWVNNDSVSHTLVSGVKSFYPGKPNKPDGKMDTGSIPPGESYSTTIEESGIIRFFEPGSYWLDGTIVSLPTTESKVIKERQTQIDKQGFE